MGELGALDLYVPGNTPQTTPERKAYVLASVPKATQNGETTANFDVSSENQQDFLKQILSASVTNHNVVVYVFAFFEICLELISLLSRSLFISFLRFPDSSTPD